MTEYVIHAIHDCVMHNLCSHRLIEIDWSGKYSRWSYEKLREKIRDVFQLPPSAPFELKYNDSHSDELSIVNDESLYDAQIRQGYTTLCLRVVNKCSSPFVRVVHDGTFHLLTPPLGQLEFCYDELHGRVREQLHLSHSADFVFRFKDLEVSGPQMIVANSSALRYALEKESPTHLELEIKAIEEDNENICHSSGKKSTSKTSQDVVKIRHNGTIRSLALSPGELESSCEKFQSRVRDVFNLSCSIELELIYVDADGDTVTISKGEKIKDALSRQPGEPLRLDMATNSSVVRRTSSYVVKVRHNGTVRRLTLSPDEFQFSYEKFRNSIRDLFKLPCAIQFLLSYVDEDEDSITMVEDEDLRDALVMQSLHPLKVNMTIIEGGVNHTNLNRRIAHNQAYSCEGTDEAGERSLRQLSESSCMGGCGG